jgi:hypothetical protein
LSAKAGLFDFGMVGGRGSSAAVNVRDSSTVCSSEDRSDIQSAPKVIQQHFYGAI